jgi:hypothetical protein
MNRLTPFARIVIIALILAAVFFGYRKFVAPKMTSDNATEEVDGTNEAKTNNNTVSEASESTNVSEASEATSAPFNFTPPVPVNGKLKGVVELGATGFNSFIVNIDAQKNWKLEKADYGASLVYENMATDDDIKAGLKNYIADMLAFGVNGKNIHFVISSGAKKAEVTGKIISSLKSLGFVVNEVTPEQEGKLALKCVLPNEYANKAFVTDIGSGNTKISWVQNGVTTGIEAPGSKFFEKLEESIALGQVKSQAQKVPSALSNTCFIIGGIPFELAKQTRNGKERYTVLNDPSSYTPKGEKQKAGLGIYKTIKETSGCNQFVFDWDANFTIGFLLSL